MDITHIPDIVRELVTWGNTVTVEEVFGVPDDAITWCQNLNLDVELVHEEDTYCVYEALSPDKDYKVKLVGIVDKTSYEYQYLYLKQKEATDENHPTD